ncbi:hypothetical protein RhiirA4_490737 [Rhizophagus irregularis]|uniref:Uncharacterized protein n=1 Tax=Rhizophagus irregularis TaxID=588596 RepID=A0A2I1HVX0_9GLOM|nr:hypothetical protein RhiirA4_490737 [Rhizophagus irregularis]
MKSLHTITQQNTNSDRSENENSILRFKMLKKIVTKKRNESGKKNLKIDEKILKRKKMLMCEII